MVDVISENLFSTAPRCYSLIECLEVTEAGPSITITNVGMPCVTVFRKRDTHLSRRIARPDPTISEIVLSIDKSEIRPLVIHSVAVNVVNVIDWKVAQHMKENESVNEMRPPVYIHL